jgi:hypothetical protein
VLLEGGLESLVRLVLLPLLPILFASPVAALTISPNPIQFNESGLVGSLDLLDVVLGVLTGGAVDDGSVGATDTTLVFRATAVESFPQDTWTLVRLSLQQDGTTLLPIAGVGRISSGGFCSIFPAPSFTDCGPVAEGQSMDFFVSYSAPIAEDGSVILQAVVGEGVTFAFGQATVVPEPALAGLLALAALTLGWRRRAAPAPEAARTRMPATPSLHRSIASASAWWAIPSGRSPRSRWPWASRTCWRASRTTP